VLKYNYYILDKRFERMKKQSRKGCGLFDLKYYEYMKASACLSTKGEHYD